MQLSTDTRNALIAEAVVLGRAIRFGVRKGFNVDGMTAELELILETLEETKA